MKRAIVFVLCSLVVGAALYPLVGLAGASGSWLPVVSGQLTVKTEYRWQRSVRHPNEIHLYVGDRCIGGYNFTDGFYRKWDGQRWGQPTVSPTPPPFEQANGDDAHPHFGLDHSKIDAAQKIWEGARVYCHEEFCEIMAGGLPEDTKAPHVTIVERTPGLGKKIADDFNAKTAGMSPEKKPRIQAYDAGNPVTRLMLAPFKLDSDEKFKQSGVITLVQLAAKDGETTSPAWKMYDPPSGEKIIEALRQCDPWYDPNKGGSPVVPGLPGVPWEAWIIIAIGVFVGILWLRNRNQ